MLEQQAATSDILRAISRSPHDPQPVFKAIVDHAHRVCGAAYSILYGYDGTNLSVLTSKGVDAKAARIGAAAYPAAPRRDHIVGRAVLEAGTMHTHDLTADPRFPANRNAFTRALQSKGAAWRAVLVVPLLHETSVLGAISVGRARGRKFAPHEIRLLQSFADHAVVAIGNARLFNETKEALEQQTASAQVLGSISSSIADTKPVFDKIVESCARLFEGHHVGIALVKDDGLAHLAAYSGAQREEFERTWPVPVSTESAMGRAILSQQVVHWADVTSGDGVPPYLRRSAEKNRARSVIVAPMLWEGRGIGGIWVGREFAAPFTEKVIRQLSTFADQAVIAIQNARMFREIQDRNTELKQSLEFQGAMSEILASISNSIADPQPVFDAINSNLLRLVGARFGAVMLVRDNQIHVPAVMDAKGDPDFHRILERYPIPLDERTAAGQAILSGKVVHLTPVIGNPAAGEAAQANARAFGYDSIISAPMMRDGTVVGAVTASRLEARAFEDKEIALIKAFADQAVIAIENARLFNETKEALERQTATAEILNVISRSPTDVQPVFETIVRSAIRLVDGRLAGVFTSDGKHVHIGAAFLGDKDLTKGFAADYPAPMDYKTASVAAIRECRVFNVPDVLESDFSRHTKERARQSGYRAVLAVPMVRAGAAIGSIVVTRTAPGLFPDHHVTLLRTFADQAVIAIENVRLFRELQARTEALTKSVGQLTALGDVGRAIGSTLDLETVLKTIVSRALQLTGFNSGSIYEYDEQAEEFRLRAGEGMTEETVAILRNQPIRKGEGAVGTTAVKREPVQVADIQADRYDGRLREILVRAGRRAVLAVPLLHEQRIIGALAVQKDAVGPFAPEVVELLKTFATQSAMAIQNARLYREIAEKGKQLETASQHKSQFLASMSHELRTPLNAILGFNEMLLGEVYGPVPQGMQEPLKDIQTSGRHLLRLINNVLDLAKIEAGRMELALADYSVQDTVAGVHATLRPLAAEKGLDFVTEVPADLPLAHGDAGRLMQCLMNLAGNSLKFTKQGRVAIAVQQSNGVLRYSVTDTGIGIPPEKLDSLFTEFKQTDATIASEFGGTGLGLSITKKFIEMHGGRIWVESEPGKGSAFKFEVPLRVAG